jgi:hypothetical protein
MRWGDQVAAVHPIAECGAVAYHQRRRAFIMSYLIPPWRSFRTLDSNSEAANASACCDFSFATLEIACGHPGAESFALTERKHVDDWRWAVCSATGRILCAGDEPTQMGAKCVAEEALRVEAS